MASRGAQKRLTHQRRAEDLFKTPMAFHSSDAQWADFLRKIESLPKEFVEGKTREHHEESERLFERFKDGFAKGMCSCCDKPLATFSKGAPCSHWLLRPKGVKKDDLEELFHAKGYFRTASYVRWVANQGAYLSRINDLDEEGASESVFHWSAVHKHIKWTFWCTPSDYAGHHGTRASYPHFHVAMKLNGLVFVKFGDFHVPFTDEDLFNLRCNADPRSPIKQSFGAHGAGMNAAVTVPLDKIVSETKTTDDKTKGVYRIQTLITAEEGKRIPSEVIEEIIRKSQETGKTMAHFVKESGLNAEIIVSPNDAVPEKEIRNNPREK
jgi:hypothetical protein